MSSKTKNIWQLAFVEKDICPVCGNRIVAHKTYEVTIFTLESNEKSYSCNTLYCNNCNLPFANADISNRVFRKTGFLLRTFPPEKNSSVKSIRRRMYSYEAIHFSSTQKRGSKKIFERIPSNTTIWKPPKILCSISNNFSYCPGCHGKLSSDHTYIPVSKDERAKVPGKLCHSCGIMYVEKSDELINILRDNPLSKGFSLDGRELWNASAVAEIEKRKKQAQALRSERKRCLRETPDSVVMICINRQGCVKDIIITNHSTNTKPSDSNIICYKSEEGRELLSAAFADERDKKGVVKGEEFQVLEVIFAEKSTRQQFQNNMLPTKLTIKADGGYHSSIKNRNYEVVDVLVYSLLTQRYELMRATYKRDENYCFTDISNFRSFVHNYGKPQAEIDFYSTKRINCDELRSESVLMGYGYNVSESNHLSDSKRQEILAEIVDLEILKVHQVVKLLDFNCSLHCSDKYYLARLKWQIDKNFIENYKVNPKRFFIANNVI